MQPVVLGPGLSWLHVSPASNYRNRLLLSTHRAVVSAIIDLPSKSSSTPKCSRCFFILGGLGRGEQVDGKARDPTNCSWVYQDRG